MVSVNILIGDVRERLAGLPSDSVDCCVTSPPYWGLRDYGVEGQIGMEPTLAEHMAVMVDVFEQVRRVLKPTGTLWLNYGDCYATAPNGRSAADAKVAGGDDRTFRDKPFSTVGPIVDPGYNASPRGKFKNGDRNVRVEQSQRVVSGGYLKPKDLCMLPNRLAIALQDAGWWVRSEIIWGKPNPMPDSSGAYRPSSAHEKIFLLTKSGDADVWRARDTGEISFAPDLGETCPLITKPNETGARWIRLGAYYDAGAVMMPVSENTHARVAQDVVAQRGSARANGGTRADRPMKAVVSKKVGVGPKTVPVGTFKTRQNESMHEALVDVRSARLLRNFEPDLSELVPPDVMAWEIAIAGFSGAHFATFPPALVVPCILAGCPAGGTVLDPFGGAGTTGMVAERLGREAILIELNHAYADIARDRLRLAQCKVRSDLPEKAHAAGPLFGTAAA